MTNTELIRQEIERRIGAMYNFSEGYSALNTCRELLDFIDKLPKESVTDCHRLEDEIDSEWAKCKPIDEGMGLESAIIVNEQFDDIARHFAKWGAEHKEQPAIDENEIEKAARIYARDNWIAAENWEDAAHRTFIAGAKCGAEHLKK